MKRERDQLPATPPDREQVIETARKLFAHYGWSNPGDLEMRARIEKMRDMALASIASEIPDIEALKRDAARWREHAKIMKECAREEAVHFRITKHHAGKVWGVEYVFSHIDLSAVGEELAAARVGEAAALKYRQLTRAFEEPSDVAR